MTILQFPTAAKQQVKVNQPPLDNLNEINACVKYLEQQALNSNYKEIAEFLALARMVGEDLLTQKSPYSKETKA